MLELKKCTKCGEIKSVKEFYKDKRKDGLFPWCKECVSKTRRAYYENNSKQIKEKSREYRKNNTEKVRKLSSDWAKKNKEKVNETNRQWSLRNKEKVKIIHQIWYQNNIERSKETKKKYLAKNYIKVKEKNKRWANNNPQAVRDIYKRSYIKRTSTPCGKLNHSISSGVNQCLRGSKSGRHWETLVGYTVDQLKQRLEKQFQLGMTWENYGLWHIDHIIPLSAHNFQSPEDIDFKRAWALKNLQPMWAKENIKKSNKLTKPFQPSLTL
jgi:predicted  nucleic acid-binding Zn-ribbon protein